MRKFQRVNQPDFLVDRWKTWGEEWERRRSENPKAGFNWRQFNGTPVNQLLLPPLKAQTQDHCSFCDAFPVSPPAIDTIEHFRPKSTFPKDAYRWDNLYFCCMYCQQKGDDFNEDLLRPDADDYDFDQYFRWDFTRGRIEINELAPEKNQRRAEVTIRLYRLNEKHPTLRRLEMRRRKQGQNDPLDEFAYRHYVGSPPAGRL
jgi:uncharacterized protein (TIGR02646 family)